MVELMRRYGGNVEQCYLDSLHNFDLAEMESQFATALVDWRQNVKLNFDTGAGRSTLVA